MRSEAAGSNPRPSRDGATKGTVSFFRSWEVIKGTVPFMADIVNRVVVPC